MNLALMNAFGENNGADWPMRIRFPKIISKLWKETYDNASSYTAFKVTSHFV